MKVELGMAARTTRSRRPGQAKRDPGPITPNVNCCSMLWPLSHSPQTSAVDVSALSRGGRARGVSSAFGVFHRAIGFFDQEHDTRLVPLGDLDLVAGLSDQA